jgi:cytochrome P450
LLKYKQDDPLLPQMVTFVFKKLHNPSNPSALTRDRVVDSVAGRILGILFAAIDTTTATFCQAFLDLASHPRAMYADVIKAEIGNAIATQKGELNAAALGKLKHLDR